MPNNRVVGVKKSRFQAVPTIPSTATFDFVSAGQNLKVTFENLLLNLGVTGTLQQEGDPLGVPVLDPQGSINGIRNLEQGFGITLNLSPQNGIEIATGFTFDEVGAVLVTDPVSPTPVFRSIEAGDGINVAEDGQQIVITATQEVISTKTVFVNELSDLPSPVLDEINLDDNTNYFFSNDVNLGVNRLIWGENTVISSANAALITLTYTGTGVMHTLGSGTNTIQNIKFVAASGTCFNSVLGGTVSGRNFVVEADIFGTFTDVPVFLMRNFNATCTTNGALFSGPSNGTLNFSFFIMNISAGTTIDLGTALFDSIRISTCEDFSNNSFFLSGLAASGNINAGGLAIVASVNANGSATPLSGISEDDSLYTYIGNNKIKDTIRSALAHVTGGATTTVIGATGVPQLLLATYIMDIASGWTVDATGRITNDQDKAQRASLTASISALRTGGGGGADNFTFFFNVDGTTILDTGVQKGLENTDTQNTTLVWEADIDPGSFIEIWVQRDQGANNVIGQDIKFRVS